MRTIKTTLIVMLLAIFATMQMQAQKKSSSSGSVGKETKELCTKLNELTLLMPVYVMGGESTVNKLTQALKNTLSHYETSKEKLTQSSRKALVDSYTDITKTADYCALSLQGMDPRTGKGKRLLDESTAKSRAKYKKVTNQCTTLGQFIKKVQE